jgi:hypothetical protein
MEQLRVPKLLAGALAAVSGAVVASLFGVEGTLIGAALVSLLVAPAEAVYSHSLASAHRVARRSLVRRVGEHIRGSGRRRRGPVAPAGNPGASDLDQVAVGARTDDDGAGRGSHNDRAGADGPQHHHRNHSHARHARPDHPEAVTRGWWRTWSALRLHPAHAGEFGKLSAVGPPKYLQQSRTRGAPEVMRSTTAVRPNTGVRDSPEEPRTCWSDNPCRLRKSGGPADLVADQR